MPDTLRQSLLVLLATKPCHGPVVDRQSIWEAFSRRGRGARCEKRLRQTSWGMRLVRMSAVPEPPFSAIPRRGNTQSREAVWRRRLLRRADGRRPAKLCRTSSSRCFQRARPPWESTTAMVAVPDLLFLKERSRHVWRSLLDQSRFRGTQYVRTKLILLVRLNRDRMVLKKLQRS